MNIDALKHFPEAIQFIYGALETPGGKVLLHCLEGKSRSSTFTLAFMMEHL
jgi:atypical dual specificity phosphatase